MKAVKGGAYDFKRTDCRTEAKNTAKDASKGYPNVTIRLVRESRNVNQQDDLSPGDAEARRHGGTPPATGTLHLRVSVLGPLPMSGMAKANAASAALAPEATTRLAATSTWQSAAGTRWTSITNSKRKHGRC